MRTPMTPFWKPGETITAHAKSAVTGRRFVNIAGARVDGNPQVAHDAADVYAVAAYDAPAGGKVTIYRGGVLEVEAGAAITAGAYVKSDAAGKAIVGAKTDAVGRALDDIAAGATGAIDMGR